MFIYNVTLKVQDAIQEEWLTWLKQEHIPEITGTGCFSHANILRLMETDDSEGPTYAIQYLTESIALYELYIEKYSGIIRQRSIDKWGDRFIAFRSLLKVVN